MHAQDIHKQTVLQDNEEDVLQNVLQLRRGCPSFLIRSLGILQLDNPLDAVLVLHRLVPYLRDMHLSP